MLVDFNHLFHRMKHMAAKNSSNEEKIGLSVHSLFVGMASVWNKCDVQHCVVALEGYSWRKNYYAPYKKNRLVAKLKKTEAELELDEEFQMAANSFVEFLQKKTATTVIQTPNSEADDIIATFILDRPDDEHIIISSDSDFQQLITKNVSIYDPVKGHIITIDGVFNDSGKPVIDNKTKQQKTIGDPEYVLFKKIIRGDSSDNIKSALPRIREKSTKNKLGIDALYEDRHAKSFAWNSIMLSEWVDEKGETHLVKDDFLRNKILIDLTEIPEFVKNEIRTAIDIETQKSLMARDIGFAFFKFCGKYGLTRISENMNYYTSFLVKHYND